ncbi:hypothetical protein QYM41_17395 [Kocuria sp. CPCC 205268]|uniref:hypothetical protein n=1 Tax=Kocuria oxytropis TaxID=3058913 RepID=UPI0034D77F7B
MNHRTRSYGSLLVALGLAGAVAGCGEGTDDLPAFDSLEATYRAVDEIVDCSADAPEPAVKFPGSGKDTGESVMCTSTVEVLWFDHDEAREDVYELLSDTAGDGSSVYFVEGRNWFVVDGAEVMVGAVPERRIDMEQLADALDARYTVER